MAKFKIGITEAGDAGIDLSWEEKLNDVDGAILITKEITDDFIAAVMRHKDNVIVHTSVTGYGGWKLEPKVPEMSIQCSAILKLVESGFSKEKIVIRIDPIIPTEIGLIMAKRVFHEFIFYGFSRYRVSLIDMYPHVRNRFKKAGIELPYGKDGFSPLFYHVENTNEMLRGVKEKWERVKKINELQDDLRIEACAEPGLTEAIACGCVSKYDLDLLGLHDDDIDSVGFQRKNCLCYSGKTELLHNKMRCEHQCLYCYWK